MAEGMPHDPLIPANEPVAFRIRQALGLAPPTWLSVCDLVVSILILLFNLIIWAGEIIHVGMHEGVLFMALIGLLPIVLMMRRTLLAAIGFALISFPSSCLLGMYCDASTDNTWGVLHAGHDWLFLICAYSVIRILAMLIMQERAAEDLG